MMTDHADDVGGRVRWAATAWALTVASAVVYAILLQGPHAASDEVQFYLWAAGVSAAPILVAVLALGRLRYFALAVLAALAVGSAGAYCLALITYGSGTEDGTVWRGIGGAMLGVISAIWAWVVMRLRLRRSNHANAS